MDRQLRKQRTLDAIKRLLVRESLVQPLLIIFEDLHWFDT
jgi:predicted ATPase